jgi:hypothetical protein
VFNSHTGDCLEEKNLEDRFRFKAASLNHVTGDIILVAHNVSTAKNIIQSKIFSLKEIPAQS